MKRNTDFPQSIGIHKDAKHIFAIRFHYIGYVTDMPFAFKCCFMIWFEFRASGCSAWCRCSTGDKAPHGDRRNSRFVPQSKARKRNMTRPFHRIETKGPDTPTCQFLPISSQRKVKMGWERRGREKRWWRIGVCKFRVSVVGERSVCKRVVCRSGVRVCERVVCVCESAVGERVVWDRSGCKSVVCPRHERECVCVKRIVCV